MKQISNSEWHRLLNLYVADEESMRPALMNPFEQDGYVCATDTHTLIRVDKKYITDDYTTQSKVPNVSKVIPVPNPTFAITDNELRKAFSILRIDYDATTVDCPECDDECEVEWEYTDRDGDKHTMYGECPSCNGTGRVPNGADKICEIGDKTICSHFILLLYHVMIALGIGEIKGTFGDKGQILFHVENGIDVVVMSCLLDKNSSKLRAPIKVTKL